MTLHRQD